MGETDTPVGSADPRDLVVVDQGGAAELNAPLGGASAGRPRRRVGSFVAGGIRELRQAGPQAIMAIETLTAASQPS